MESFGAKPQSIDDREAKSFLLDHMADKLNHAMGELHNENLRQETLVQTVGWTVGAFGGLPT